MATTKSSDGQVREIVERYAVIGVAPVFAPTRTSVLVKVREDDTDERAWLKATGYTLRAGNWELYGSQDDCTAALSILIERGYSVLAPRLVSTAHAPATREALSAILGRQAKSNDFVFPNPLFS